MSWLRKGIHVLARVWVPLTWLFGIEGKKVDAAGTVIKIVDEETQKSGPDPKG